MPVSNWIARIVGWLFLTAFQVLVLNHLVISSYVHPYIFPMFVMLLPFSTPRWIILVLAFTSGLLVDMFNNTPGMHAAAMLVMAYARPAVIRLLTPITGYEGMVAPSLGRLGFIWFLFYALILTAIHHFVYFNLEILSFKNIGYTLITWAASTLFSVFLMINFAFIFTSSKPNERK
jgi:rod shape-determining protein MreD